MGLADCKISTMLPVTDVDRATAFYSDQLSLPYLGSNAEGNPVYALAGGTSLVLLPRPAGSQAQHTALSFEVTDIGSEIRSLEAQGVTFADYDLPDLKTTDHVCVIGAEKAAWFLDPDGNVLCLHEQAGEEHP